MKILLLMRHAKSSWKNSKLSDKDRPITHRGEKDILKMGEFLCEKELLPDVILTSTVQRCRLTARVVLDQCAGEITLKVLDALYMAEPAGIIDILKKVDDQAQRVMVIGHNPGLEGLLQGLSGVIESLPTASIAYFELPIEHWADLSPVISVKKWDKWRPKDA